MTYEALPNIQALPGAVCPQWRVRSGKRYGPYWFRFWREGGKLKKQYVPTSELPAVRAACDAHRARQRAERLQKLDAVAKRQARSRFAREVFKQLNMLWDLECALERFGDRCIEDLTPLQQKRCYRGIAALEYVERTPLINPDTQQPT